MQESILHYFSAVREADFLLDIRNNMFTEVLRIAFHIFGLRKSTVDSRNGPNNRNHALVVVIFHGCFRYLIFGRSQDIMMAVLQKNKASSPVKKFTKFVAWQAVSSGEFWNLSLSRPWDISGIFYMDGKGVVEYARQSPMRNENWPAFLIMCHLWALLCPAGNAFAIFHSKDLECRMVISTREFHLNFLKCETLMIKIAWVLATSYHIFTVYVYQKWSAIEWRTY